MAIEESLVVREVLEGLKSGTKDDEKSNELEYYAFTPDFSELHTICK